MTTDPDRDVMDDPDFRRLRTVAKSITDDDWDMVPPPSTVWSGIQLELAHEAPVTSLETARSRRRPSGILFGAIAASIIAVVAVASLVSSSGDEVVGEAELAALDAEAQAVGSAKVVQRDDRLWVDLAFDDVDLPSADEGFLELWIIDREVDGMVSLGIVDGDGQFLLPAGLRTSDFPIVDVSLEPVDGDPTHSGNSLYRGTWGNT